MMLPCDRKSIFEKTGDSYYYITDEYRQMAKDFIEWKKLHPKGFMAKWDYFVKHWRQRKKMR